MVALGSGLGSASWLAGAPLGLSSGTKTGSRPVLREHTERPQPTSKSVFLRTGPWGLKRGRHEAPFVWENALGSQFGHLRGRVHDAAAVGQHIDPGTPR